jgi:hypothetical protein
MFVILSRALSSASRQPWVTLLLYPGFENGTKIECIISVTRLAATPDFGFAETR